MLLNIIKSNNPNKKWSEDLNRHFSKEDVQMTKRHVKRGSMSLIVREMQVQTTMRYHLSPIRMTIIKKTHKQQMLERVWREGSPLQWARRGPPTLGERGAPYTGREGSPLHWARRGPPTLGEKGVPYTRREGSPLHWARGEPPTLLVGM